MPSRNRVFVGILCVVVVSTFDACYSMRRFSGGGQTPLQLPRAAPGEEIAVPDGYTIQAVARELTSPTGITFDEHGKPYVIESGYRYGEEWTTPRLLRIDAGGTVTQIATGANNGPWNGVVFRDGAFYVAEGGELEGGRILKIMPDGTIAPIVSNLPSFGDHHTNGPAAGPDGWIYFAIGTATNSGVVGVDNAEFGWLKRKPEFHDVPCRDVTLSGENFLSWNAFARNNANSTVTGPFSPFGKSTARGQVVHGQVPCSGAILKISPSGGNPELVAWGFRNPFGLAFAPDGRLFVTDNGYDERGSRPVWGTDDLLWNVTPGAWYGWPDYSGDRLLSEKTKPPGKPSPRALLSPAPGKPPKPVAVLGVRSRSDGLDFSRADTFGHAGQAFIAQFGDHAPVSGKALRPAGFRVVRVDVETGVIHDFAVNNAGTNGRGSRTRSGGLERPVAVRFDPKGTALYVVDFGVLTMSERGAEPKKGTGVIWRITRSPRVKETTE